MSIAKFHNKKSSKLINKQFHSKTSDTVHYSLTAAASYSYQDYRYPLVTGARPMFTSITRLAGVIFHLP